MSKNQKKKKLISSKPHSIAKRDRIIKIIYSREREINNAGNICSDVRFAISHSLPSYLIFSPSFYFFLSCATNEIESVPLCRRRRRRKGGRKWRKKKYYKAK